MSTYRRKPNLATGIQVEADTTVDGLHGPVFARAGEWVVREHHISGDIERDITRVLTDDQFATEYEDVPSAGGRGIPYVCWSGTGEYASEIYTMRGLPYIALFREEHVGRLPHRPATPDEVARGVWIDA